MKILQHKTYLATFAIALLSFGVKVSAFSVANQSYHQLKASVKLCIKDHGFEPADFFMPPPPSTFSVRVKVGSDDAEQNLSTGASVINSNDLELVVDGSANQIVGLRFNLITVPPGATITNAYVEFETDAAWSTACNLTFQGQAADNPTTFTTTNSYISSRPKTTASVAWTPLSWPVVNGKHQTPNLNTIIQEIVNRPGWASGNSMVIFAQGTGTREAESYEGENAAAPLLVVEYDFQALVEICDNGIDDDGDGLIDFYDHDCAFAEMEVIPSGSFWGYCPKQ